jgi:hypothetical protein
VGELLAAHRVPASGNRDRPAIRRGGFDNRLDVADGRRPLDAGDPRRVQLRVDVVDEERARVVTVPVPAATTGMLWICTALIVLRVAGQLIVWTTAPRWLPPMGQWQSGLLPYPVLLAGQAVVLLLMGWISIDFSRGDGFWVQPHPSLGKAAVVWSVIYAAAMAARYVVRMIRRPDQRWSGGSIPIVFHIVVAAFQWTFGTFHAGWRI